MLHVHRVILEPQRLRQVRVGGRRHALSARSRREAEGSARAELAGCAQRHMVFAGTVIGRSRTAEIGQGRLIGGGPRQRHAAAVAALVHRVAGGVEGGRILQVIPRNIGHLKQAQFLALIDVCGTGQAELHQRGGTGTAGAELAVFGICEGLLVANDASASRTKALLKNLEVFGLPNILVTSEMGDKLDRYFHEYFDKILIDAPCSGEGMFRKQAHMIPAWERQGPEVFSKMQREILDQAANLLKPGGTMLYSTCTFSKLENEGSMDYFLSNHPEFHLLDIPQSEGFAPGQPELVDSTFPLEKCVRLFPHKIDGEGHFLALLQKDGERTPNALESAGKPSKLPQELTDFLKEVSMPVDTTRIQIKDTKVFLMPEGLSGCKGLRFLRSGLYMGELLKKRFEPSQAFAMVLKKEEYASVIDLPATDERIIRYLKGETIEIEDGESTKDAGWQLVCVDGYPLGWGKLIRGTLRNKYFSGWRMNA